MKPRLRFPSFACPYGGNNMFRYVFLLRKTAMQTIDIGGHYFTIKPLDIPADSIHAFFIGWVDEMDFYIFLHAITHPKIYSIRGAILSVP